MPQTRAGSSCRPPPTRRCPAFRRSCATFPNMPSPGRPEALGRDPMQTSSLVVEKAQRLAAAGHHAEVVEYLGAQEGELTGSPTLALLYGTAQARLGRHDEGLKWLDTALDEARKREEQTVERHALNTRGAVALVSGRIDEAADYFTQALMAASRDGDLATTARCSNNLGIISNLRGRHAEAIGSWEIAVAAFDLAWSPAGVAAAHHNLATPARGR